MDLIQELMRQMQRETLTDVETEYLTMYLTSVLGLRTPISHTILVATQSAMQGTDTPTPLEIARQVLSPPCPCLQVPADERAVQAVVHILQDFKECPTCPMIEAMHIYFLAEKRYPTRTEFLEMMANDLRLQHDPEQYCSDKRLLVPTAHLEKLTPFENDQKERNCSICQDPIAVGTSAYLLPCGDSFHAHACLGEGQSVVTWLQRCKRCPNCNQEVVLV